MNTRPNSFFAPFYKAIDRVIFGIKEPKELEDQPEVKEPLIETWSEEKEDKVAIRSSN